MRNQKVPSQASGNLRQITISDGFPRSEVATILAGLEQQKEELGPIAEEIIDLLHHLGVGKPPLRGINPSSE